MTSKISDEECTIKQIKDGCEKAGIPNEEKTIAYAVGFLAGKLGMGDSNERNDAPSTGTREPLTFHVKYTHTHAYIHRGKDNYV